MMMLLGFLWLGILTSINPCPLASNIAAMSFIANKVSKPSKVLINGLSYTLGRALFYIVVGAALAGALNAIPQVSMFLQTKMMYFVAPLLIVIGVIMLGVLHIHLPKIQFNQNKIAFLADKGALGSFILGFIFAAALCPVAAGLFFSTVISSQGAMLPLTLYGIGTGLPVMLLAFVLAFSINKIGNVFKKTQEIELYLRKGTGAIFVLIGIYFLWGMF